MHCDVDIEVDCDVTMKSSYYDVRNKSPILYIIMIDDVTIKCLNNIFFAIYIVFGVISFLSEY